MNQTLAPRSFASDPLRIVLIDDNPDDCDHIRRTLLAGLTRRFELFEATTGDEGIQLCSKVAGIDCVMLDMHLPDMTGLDVLGAVREEHGDIVWPVVVLTGSTGVGEPAAVLRAGAQDFIAKEWITPESLARALGNATLRHKLHQDLRHAEERLRLALAAADMGTWDWDLATNRVIWSEGHYSILGYPDADFDPTYEHWRSRVHPEDLAGVEEALKKSRERNSEYRYAYRVVWPDRSVHWIEARGRYMLGAGRTVERMHGIMFDVAESKLATGALAKLNAELETRIAERTAQLVQAQKLDMVGQITGALAHDFNNLLYAILGNLEVLQRRSAGDAAALKLIEGALQGARRGSDLTKRLMSFVRREELRSQPVDVLGLLDGMDDLLRRSVGPMIEVRIVAEPDLWQARVDPSQLELALLNLAVNARDAMPAGGTITVKMGNETVAGGAPYQVELQAGDYVRVTVTDSGIGMDAATLARATEPFFTTKSDGKGTGLGLASVHGLALQSGGALRLTSRSGEGATVEMWLPKASADAPAQPAADPAAVAGDAAPRKLKVLLVDDDALISVSTEAVLKDLGHTVQIASSGRKALDVLLADPGIELVISDHAMPGMSGLELVERIRQRWPRLPILLATGYDDLTDADRNLPRILKPYSQHELAKAIQDVMDAAARDRALLIGTARSPMI